MNRQDIIVLVQALGCESLVVGAGAAMVLWGFKETTKDIDATVSTEDFKRLLETTGAPPSISRMGDRMIVLGDIEIFECTQPEYTFIDGVKVETEKSLVDFYIKSGRAKDHEHLKYLI